MIDCDPEKDSAMDDNPKNCYTELGKALFYKSQFNIPLALITSNCIFTESAL